MKAKELRKSKGDNGSVQESLAEPGLPCFLSSGTSVTEFQWNSFGTLDLILQLEISCKYLL